MRSRWGGFAALAAAGAITIASGAPGYAATIVSQATANALTLSIAGSPADSGTVKATNDGSGEVKKGETAPPIDVLGNQDLINLGVLAQDATAYLDGRDGVSEACAGVAGNGGSVATIGDSNCITPGDPIGLNIANLDLTGTVLVDPESALGGLAALQPIIDDVVGPLTQAITDALAPLASTGIGGSLGAVESRCMARPGDVTGKANIVDGALTADVGGTEIELLDLPVEPPPNTKLVTDLDVVLNTLLEALETDLNNTLDGALASLSLIIDPIQQEIVDTLIADIADQLAPLEENILEVTLNKQVKTADRITVTALDLELLPAATDTFGAAAVDLEIANVTCGPNARLQQRDPDDPTNDDDPDGPGDRGPDVPHVIDAGAAGNADGPFGEITLAVMLALTAAGGVAGYRRVARR